LTQGLLQFNITSRIPMMFTL